MALTEPMRTPALEFTELHERKSGAAIVAIAYADDIEPWLGDRAAFAAVRAIAVSGRSSGRRVAAAAIGMRASAEGASARSTTRGHSIVRPSE